MKKILYTAVLAFVVGCASTDKLMTDTTKRQPTTNVEILLSAPDTKTYKSIGALQFLGAKEDELKAIKFLQKEAGKSGAEAMYLQQEQFQKWVGFTPTIAVKYKAILFVRR